MSNTASRPVFAALAGITLLALTACGANETPPDAVDPPAPSASEEPTAMDEWDEAYAFLSEQTDDLEIICSVVDVGSDGTAGYVTGAPRTFHAFDDREDWEGETLTRSEFEPGAKDVAMCEANVPADVAFESDAINRFLAPKGLAAAGDDIVVIPGIDQVEIWYSGSGADGQYADAPGLWALYASLRGLEGAVDDEESIIPPADDETAAEYLDAAAPALEWYGYED